MEGARELSFERHTALDGTYLALDFVGNGCKQGVVAEGSMAPGGCHALFLRSAGEGDLALLEALLDRDHRQYVNIECVDSRGLNALHLAVLGERYECTIRLLHAGVPVNARDANGATPLMLAAMRGNEETFDLLVQHGANIHAKDVYGYTALFHAVLARQRYLAEHMLRHYNRRGANATYVRHVDRNDHSPLFHALAQYDVRMACVLIDHGANVNEACLDEVAMESKTTLMHAAEGNDLLVLTYCLRKRADPNLDPNGSGKTALFYAAASGATACVDALLRIPRVYGVKVNARDRGGSTPLIHAILGGHVPTIELLLCHGADPAIVDKAGRNALHLAARRGITQSHVLDLLTAHGCQVDDTDDAGRTPLMMACMGGHLATARALVLRKRYAASYACNSGCNAIHYASMADSSEIIEWLSDLMAVDIDRQNLLGKTPLMVACQYHRENAIKSLIKLGARVDLVDHDGRNALMMIRQDGTC